VASAFLRSSGIFCITIDDYEVHLLRQICAHTLSHVENLGVVAIKNNPAGRSATVGFSICHEYALFFGDPEHAEVNRLEHSESQKIRYKERDNIGFFEWTNFRKHGGVNTYRDTRPRQFYPIYVQGQALRVPAMTWDNQRREWIILEEPKKNKFRVSPNKLNTSRRVHMSLPRRTTLTRLVASALCLLALSIYITFAPAPTAFGSSCTCGGGMDNQCQNGQRCVCLFQNQVCQNCVWNDDRTCPCTGDCEIN